MNFAKVKIGQKITILIVVVVSLSIAAISFLSYTLSKTWIEERYSESLKVLSNSKVDQILHFFDEIERSVKYVKDKDQVVRLLNFHNSIEYIESANPDSLFKTYKEGLDQTLLPLESRYNYKSFFVREKKTGNLVYKTYKTENEYVLGQPFQDFEDEWLKKDQFEDQIKFSKLFNDGKRQVCLYAAAPVFKDAELIGHVIAEYELAPIYQVIEDSLGLGKTGEINLGFLDSEHIKYISRSFRGEQNTPLKHSISFGDVRENAMQKAVRVVQGNLQDFDDDNIEYLNNVPTVAYWQHIPKLGWGLVIKIDKDEINAQLRQSIISFMIAGSGIILVSVFISFFFSRFLTRPIKSLKRIIDLVAQGELPAKVEKESEDEIGEMSTEVGNLVLALKRTAHFAKRIGEGDYDADFVPLGKNDTLGNALITMRDSIQTADKRDKERNWIVSGIAEIGQILKNHNNLTDLGDEVIAFITNKIDAIQGAFYIVDQQDSQATIELKSSYAYGKKKYLKNKFKFAEGLVGQAAIEKDTILRTEIPASYVTITSGILGEQKPSCILVVPLITNELVYGLVEFAGFDRFTNTQVQFVEEISEIIARTVFNIRVNERTVNLLQESRKMSEELQLQQEVLRQNAEEMEATQEELQRTNSRLEDQILEVNRTQKRLQLLLENASEIITIYETNRIVRYISPSVEPILGYTPNEMIGRDDTEFVLSGSKSKFVKMFEKLVENPNERVTIQYEYRKSNGEWVTMEATGTNLLSDMAVAGIVVNSRDITERIRAEKEEKMRSQMQSLSENSPDLIMRIDTKGTIFYINSVIYTLFGLKPERLLNKSLRSAGMPDDVVLILEQTLADTVEKAEKMSLEINIPALDGERVMQVNAIPEITDNEIESILFVSHDITERKQAEMEINYKNKKITESINYAQRIQTAILPDDQVLRSIFPNSFVFYKPKDVVSGDFPWVLKDGNFVYVAVVDCTGHGVPGALMSLIGHFVLSDVVRTANFNNAGELLDLVHQGVTKTLRQDVNSNTKDGMDMALCMVDLTTMELQYAGAHRPLLYLPKDAPLEQLKGNKFSVGGGESRIRTNFDTERLILKPGDEIYLFSDGLTDQFGGEFNRKFSARKLKEIIEQTKRSDMIEMKQIFEKEFVDWKLDYPQTDDILLIGIKF